MGGKVLRENHSWPTLWAETQAAGEQSPVWQTPASPVGRSSAPFHSVVNYLSVPATPANLAQEGAFWPCGMMGI